MKITYNIPQEPANLVTQEQFKSGVLYRCRKVAEFHQRYLNCVAWKSTETNKVFGVTSGKEKTTFSKQRENPSCLVGKFRQSQSQR
jgi:hypothetical protein